MSTAYAKKKADYLYPIRYAGRSEVMVVSFDQVIRCKTEALINFLLKNYDSYSSIFPKLEAMKNLTLNQLFAIAISFTERELISFLQVENKGLENDIKLYNALKKSYSYNSTNILRLNIGLRHLLDENHIEKIYVIDEEMDLDKMKILQSIFGDFCNKKVFAVKGDLCDFIKEMNEVPTTIIDYSIDNILKLTKEYSNKIKDVYFLCSGALLSNYTSDLQDNKPKIKYVNWFDECKKNKICVVDLFTPILS